MPQCVAAAYHDVKQGFHVHSVQIQFLGIGTVAKPVTYRVEDLNIGKTFATRQVKVEQNKKIIASTTVGFAKRAPVAGQGIVTLEHTAPPAMPMSTSEDESDELKYIHGDRDPTIKGYALPVVTRGMSQGSNNFRSIHSKSPGTSQAPDSKLKRHWLRADGPISPVNGNMANLLALIALSDIFLLDSAPRIYGLGPDLKTETSLSERLARDYKAMTTINHSIHIVNVDAVRVDEWIYVECETPWASSGRVMVHSRMFSREGVLLATCVQEVSRAVIPILCGISTANVYEGPFALETGRG